MVLPLQRDTHWFSSSLSVCGGCCPPQCLLKVHYKVNTITACCSYCYCLWAVTNRGSVAHTLGGRRRRIRTPAYSGRGVYRVAPISAEKCSSVRVCQLGSVGQRRRVINHHPCSRLVPYLEEREHDSGQPSPEMATDCIKAKRRTSGGSYFS